jgi:hypothetical protein
VFSCALLCGSCTQGLNRVEGQVLHKGKPISGVVVTLHPVQGGDDIKAVRPSGVSGEDGTFRLSSGKEEGAAPGEYVVTAVWLKQPATPKKVVGTEPPPEPEDAFQGRYEKRENSKLKVTIKPGSNKFEPFNFD